MSQEVKCIRVRGKMVNGAFRATNYQLVSDSISGLTDDDHNTIMNVLRLRLRSRRSTRGFNYAFPLVFGT